MVAQRHDVVGRGHAERLLPMVADLPDGGRADAIVVDCGPGSFTGVRVGLAAALGLGIGWDVPVAGMTSLALIAVAAFDADPDLRKLAAVLEGGHGEVFMQLFDRTPFAATSPLASLAPDAALRAVGGLRAFGNGVRHLTMLDPHADIVEVLPRAADAMLLPAGQITLPARPIYGRPPDAKIPAA